MLSSYYKHMKQLLKSVACDITLMDRHRKKILEKKSQNKCMHTVRQSVFAYKIWS